MFDLAGTYWFEPYIRWMNSVSPAFCRHFSNYLRQYVGYTIPPCLWMLFGILGLIMGFYWLYVLNRAGRFGQ
jgi:hypothetical protein